MSEGGRGVTGVIVTRDGPVACLTLNRPERGNALDGALLLRELPAAWCEVRDDAAVRVVILTGAGERHFTTGIDMDDPEVLRYAADADHAPARFTARQLDVWKPVITAVNGACLGGGLALVADSDIVLASTNATFQNPGVTHDMVVAQGSVALARRCGLGPVLFLAAVGAHGALDADAARVAGIVHEVFAPDALVDAAWELAARIARNPPAPVAAVLRAIWETASLPLPEALARASEHQRTWTAAKAQRT